MVSDCLSNGYYHVSTVVSVRKWDGTFRSSGVSAPVAQSTMHRLIVLLALAAVAFAQPAPTSGKRVRRLLIHNAMVVDGNGTPASGPKDIVIENNLITDVIPLDPVSLSRGGRGGAQADAVIDAGGRY